MYRYVPWSSTRQWFPSCLIYNYTGEKREQCPDDQESSPMHRQAEIDWYDPHTKHRCHLKKGEEGEKIHRNIVNVRVKMAEKYNCMTHTQAMIFVSDFKFLISTLNQTLHLSTTI